MTSSATAAHRPERCSAEWRWGASASLRVTASLAAVLAYRSANATAPHPAATKPMRIRVASPSASPAANPAGTQATAIRSSGWAPPAASSWSGSAPLRYGPAASEWAVRSRYSQPTPAQTAATTATQPATPDRRRRPR